MIGFLFFLALQPILRKTEGRVNLRYVQVVYWLIYVVPDNTDILWWQNFIYVLNINSLVYIGEYLSLLVDQ